MTEESVIKMMPVKKFYFNSMIGHIKPDLPMKRDQSLEGSFISKAADYMPFLSPNRTPGLTLLKHKSAKSVN